MSTVRIPASVVEILKREPEPPHEFRVADDRYSLTIPTYGVTFEIDRLRREKHELLGELAVLCDLPGVRSRMWLTRTMARVLGLMSRAASAGSGTPPRSARNGRCTAAMPSISSHIWWLK